MVSRYAFDPDAIDRFAHFVADRQRIWVRRVVHATEPPWTDDPVLRRRRFTNVHRVLDPGTQYAIQAVLGSGADESDAVFDLLVYRLIGRLETHEHVGPLTVAGFDADAFEAALRDRADAGAPVFTGAYVVSGYGSVDGRDKIERVATLVAGVRDRWASIYPAIRDADDLAAAYHAIRSLRGFGNFLAYQVLVDLTYPIPALDGASLLPFSGTEWAAAGPGAQRGLDRLLADQSVGHLEAMRWLHRNREALLEPLGIDGHRLRDDRGEPVALTLADVQNCCCEFHKYEAIRTGSVGSRRRFRPDEARSAKALRRRYADAPISVDPADYPADSR